jgi:hypothetical protein
MAFHWLIGSNANEHFRDFLSASLGFRIAESSDHIGHIEKAFHRSEFANAASNSMTWKIACHTLHNGTCTGVADHFLQFLRNTY